VFADGWTPDGHLLFEELRLGGNWDIRSVSIAGGLREQALLADPAYREGAATVSPDGRWLAYVSNESGFPAIYVRPFPNVNGGKWQVSTGFATTPTWSADGRALYFLDNPEQNDPGVAAVNVQAGPTFSFSRPERLFGLPPLVRGNSLSRALGGGEFEVSPDGQRFLFVRDAESSGTPNLNVVLNWTGELTRLVGSR
jgi:serine/threonine-protein kinase